MYISRTESIVFGLAVAAALKNGDEVFAIIIVKELNLAMLKYPLLFCVVIISFGLDKCCEFSLKLTLIIFLIAGCKRADF